MTGFVSTVMYHSFVPENISFHRGPLE